MNKGTKRIISILIGMALIAGGLFAALWFIKNKPEAQRRRPMSSMVPVVETTPLMQACLPIHVECLGTVVADKTASIQAEVNGRIVAVNPNLVEGELVKKGDVLIEIESVDYELALAKAEANLLTAQSNYRIEEGQQDAVRHEMELMGSKETDSYRDLVLREPQLKSAEASVRSAKVAVESAKLDLERTKIRAPFDAVIVSTDADVGDYAQSSNVLVLLAATDRYFIRASVPLSALVPLPKIGTEPYAATVTLSDGTERIAHTHRLLPDLTQKGRMARILLVVDAPFEGNDRPLLLNEYVRVRIKGNTVENASLLPRKYLRDGNVVWLIDSGNKLNIVPAVVVQGYSSNVLVRVAAKGRAELVTSDLNAAVDGMQLRRVGDSGPAQAKQDLGQGRKGQRPDAGKAKGRQPADQGPETKRLEGQGQKRQGA